MENLINQALDVLRGAWHRRWAGVLLAWIIAVVGLIAVFRVPQNYEASARVFVDTQTLLKPLLSGLAVNTDEGPVAIVSRTLISRPNVERLIEIAKLNAQAPTQAERDRLVDNLAGRLKITSIGRDNIYTLVFRDESPEQAKRVVEGMLSTFMDANLGERREDAEQARRFIEDQIKTSAQKLEEAEAKIKQFKLRYVGILGNDGRDYYGRMTTLTQQLDQARMELRSAEQSRDAIKRELSGEDPVFLPDPNAVFNNPNRSGGAPELDARIEALRKNLDELLRRFTDQHPDVIATRNIIAQLEDQRKREIDQENQRRAKAAAEAGARSGPVMGAAERNPVYQRLKVAFAEAEAEVASVRAKNQELEIQMQRLSSTAKLVPQIEAELVQLTRDYDVQKRTYEALVSRRESAEISSNMEAAGTATFRVIDPPRVSQFPVVPNRLLLIPLVLLLALAIGAFTSFIWSQIQPIFHDSRPLRQLTGRPLLGTVSLLADPRALASRRRGRYAFIGAVAGLIVCFGIAFFFALATSRVA